jgi:hypothetical protein
VQFLLGKTIVFADHVNQFIERTQAENAYVFDQP